MISGTKDSFAEYYASRYPDWQKGIREAQAMDIARRVENDEKIKKERAAELQRKTDAFYQGLLRVGIDATPDQVVALDPTVDEYGVRPRATLRWMGPDGSGFEYNFALQYSLDREVLYAIYPVVFEPAFTDEELTYFADYEVDHHTQPYGYSKPHDGLRDLRLLTTFDIEQAHLTLGDMLEEARKAAAQAAMTNSQARTIYKVHAPNSPYASVAPTETNAPMPESLDERLLTVLREMIREEIDEALSSRGYI